MKALRFELGSPAALFAFEAAGRHRNFTRAARELGVTQAAVSKQIRTLEADIGVELFHRRHRHVELTETGGMLFDVVSKSLGNIVSTINIVRERGQARPVVIAATLAMTQYWLMPKLPVFSQIHPGVRLRILSQDEPIDLRSGVADVAIRFGKGTWADGDARHLFDSAVYPLAAPEYLARCGPIKGAADILGLCLIGYDEVDPTWVGWTAWFAASSEIHAHPDIKLQCSRVTDAIQAAARGQGVVLGWRGLTGGLEESGELVRVGDQAMQPNGSFYLVTRKGIGENHEVKVLVDWLQNEAVAIEPSRVSSGALASRRGAARPR
jgi:DNA-binding transcriptional LysR family regulator